MCGLSMLVWFLLSFVAAQAIVPSDHPCNRQCQVNQYMTCEYHFAVENYLTLSKACYNCPWNVTDCYRPDCIAASGAKRPVYAINRQIPGPAIEVCKGDKVIVLVENMLEDGMSTSLHWHGLHQNYSNFMDGVPGLTQCSIPPYETFKYEFYANNSGTHFYHSHTGFQFGDGLHGAFIVREPRQMDPHTNLYDVDSGSHVMVLTDWEDRLQVNRYEEEMHDVWSWPVKHIGLTVNGRGKQNKVVDELNITKSATTVPTYTPMESFTVQSGTRYRFRMISAATRCFFKFLIDDHHVTVISTDGNPIQPVQVGVIIIHPGERYDFVLSATQTPNDYWIKFLGMGDCVPAGGFHAILHYDGYQGNSDMMPTADPDNFDSNETVLNPGYFDTFVNKLHQSELRSEPMGEDVDYTNERVDVIKYIDLRFKGNDNSMYNRRDLYPASSRLTMITPLLNNITLKLGPVPLSTQWYDVDNKDFCNADTLDTVNGCDLDLCRCFHMYSFELGQVVELFIVGFLWDPHQMHLHGYTFRVMGSGVMSTDNSNAYQTTTLPEIIERDNNGEFPRTLINPWMKDTVTVPALGGYTIIRFKADNPGMWLFHCHNEGHLMQGMSMVIKVGNPTQFPKPTSFFPKCGGYLYQPRQDCDNDTSAAGGFTPLILLQVLMLCMIWINKVIRG